MTTHSKPKPKRQSEVPGEIGGPGTGTDPNADPTAPAGMTQPQLRLELREEHGIDMATSRLMTWGEQIHAVIQGRLDQDRYESYVDEPDEMDKMDDDGPQDTMDDIAMENAQTAAEADEDDFSDLDDMLADLSDQSISITNVDVDLDMDYVTALLADVDPNGDLADDSTDDDDPAALLTESAANRVTPTPLFIGMPDTFDYIFSGHAGASPSGAERWAHCTASLQASREFLETLTHNQQVQFAQSGTAARQGTTAHAVAESEVNFMLGNITQEEHEYALLTLALEPDEEEAYNEEMAEHLTEYVDYVQHLHQAGRPVLIEERVRAKVWLTGLHDGEVHEIPGSGDTIALPSNTENVIDVVDLKYGNGIDVSVEANPQVRIYALGALAILAEDNDGEVPALDAVRYAIVQPRLGGIKVWEESLDDLLAWRDEVLAPALTAALYGDNNLPGEGSTFSPSDSACQWCPARGGCVALAEDRMGAAASMFDEVMEAEVSGNPIDTVLMSNDRLGEVLAQMMTVVDLHADIKAEAQRRLHRGVHVPNFELVNYTPPRTWKDGAFDKITEAVENGDVPSIYKPPALMTPTQAVTLLKEQTGALAVVNDLIDVHAIKPVIGPDAARRKARGDKRKSWDGRAPEDMFGDETDATDVPAPAIEDMFPS